jgi:hypothetical protein
MSAESALQPVTNTRPPSDAGEFGYPATSLVQEFRNKGNRVHLIIDFGGTASDVTAEVDTLYANAPNGSILFNAVAGKIFGKVGAQGLANGSFKGVAIATLS